MIPHLPDEILLQIFAHLIRWEDSPLEKYGLYSDLDGRGQEALASLCVSCKRFRYIAEPILYSAFVKPENIHNRQKPLSFKPITHQPNNTLRCYLRTLLERPELALHVKTLQIRAWETEDTLTEDEVWPDEATTNDVRPMPPSIQMAHQFYQAASKLLPEGHARSDWLIALCRGDEDAEVALLLALVPNIEKLQIVFPNASMDRYGFFILHSIIREAKNYKDSAIHGFLRLRWLEARSYFVEESDLGLPLYPFSDLFCLPQLEVFKGNHVIVEGHPEDFGEWTCPPGASSVQDLYLRDSVVSSAAVAMLMTSCAALQKLDVAMTIGDSFGLAFLWSELNEPLERHKGSLQAISIDLGTESYLTDVVGQPLNSLKCFERLQDLKIQQSALIGVSAQTGQEHEQVEERSFASILPRSLESITILDPTSELFPHLEELLLNLSQVPKLRRFRIQCNDNFCPECPGPTIHKERKERFDALGALFVAAGIAWEEVHRDLKMLGEDEDGALCEIDYA